MGQNDIHYVPCTRNTVDVLNINWYFTGFLIKQCCSYILVVGVSDKTVTTWSVFEALTFYSYGIYVSVKLACHKCVFFFLILKCYWGFKQKKLFFRHEFLFITKYY
jgi:hypothetical protein